MSVNGISNVAGNYENYKTTAVKHAETEVETKETQAVVYEKSSDIVKMSKEDRAALVKQLKADEAARKSQFTSLVMDMIHKQGGTFAAAMGNDENGIWRFLAEGNFTVDAETKAEAQEAISEDGYWGVKQTSERIFDFALALSGGDEDKMDDMLAAFEKGFKEATKSWGKELPEISQKTYNAVQDLFNNYKTPSDAAME